MKILGICGSSGSGKSTVCKFLGDLGAVVLDCDQIYHDLVSASSPCLDAIQARFGEEVVKNGALDRIALRKVAFASKNAHLDLNRITHHFVKEELNNRLESMKRADVSIAVIDAPMLYEAKLEAWCDFVCAVIANPEIQVQRICLRDQISNEQAIERLNNQLSESSLRKKADFVIENNGDLALLKAQCEQLIQKVQTIC